MSRTKGLILGALLAIILFLMGYCLWEHLGHETKEKQPILPAVSENKISKADEAKVPSKRRQKKKGVKKRVVAQVPKTPESVTHIEMYEKPITVIRMIKIERKSK